MIKILLAGRVPGQAQVSGCRECRSERRKDYQWQGSKIFGMAMAIVGRLRSGRGDVRACSG